MREKERLSLVECQFGNIGADAKGVAFDSAIPAEHETYASIADDTGFRAPTPTITHRGDADIEGLPPDQIVTIPFDALTRFKGFVVARVPEKTRTPRECTSPLVQQLPEPWDPFGNYGTSKLELNLIGMKPATVARPLPVACGVQPGSSGSFTFRPPG